MQTRQLGKTDLQISPLGFGAWAIGGGDYAFGWGPQDDAASVAAIEHAVDLGINWIDTAPVYGLGHSERIVAQALVRLGSHRRPLVFTKCSLVWDEAGRTGHNLTPQSIHREAEASLRRLGVDTIDLYQIHWPAWRGASDQGISDAWGAMAALQKEGKVRHLGVSNFNVEQMQRVSRIAPVACSQPPYSILKRDIEIDALGFCAENGIGVICYSPMESGLLTGAMTRARIEAFPADDWRRSNPLFHEPALARNLALVELLREIGQANERTPGEVAIAWTLRHPAVSGAIVGLRSANQVDGIVGAAAYTLSADDLDRIDEFLTADVG